MISTFWGAFPTSLSKWGVETDYASQTFSGALYREELLAEQIKNNLNLDIQFSNRQDSVVARPKANAEVLEAVQDSFASKLPANL